MVLELEWLVVMEVKWKRTDVVEVAVGDAEYGIGLETPVVDSRRSSVPLTEPTASGLENVPGGFGAELGQIQQGSGEGSGESSGEGS